MPDQVASPAARGVGVVAPGVASSTLPRGTMAAARTARPGRGDGG